jgi:twinkle protein
MIQESSVQEIKQRANIVEVVEDFVKLKRNGANHVGLCPFHSEKSGSFTVSHSKQIYKCFGCGKSGDSVQFLMDHEKMGFTSAIEWLAKKYNVELSESKRKNYDKPVPRLEKVGKKVLQFFEERGISNNTLLRFGISEGKEWMPQFNAETAVICFNYYRGEDLVNIKFRGAKKSFKLAKNAELIFYNINSLENETECVIVEGEIDCLSMYEAGVHNSVSVPNGAAKGNQRLEYLDNCWEYFERLQKIVLCVDNDEPGEMLKEELARRLGKERCYTVQYPEGCKDANDVLVKHGKEAVADLVENAKEWPIEGIIHVEDVEPELIRFYEEGYPSGAKAGISGFDDLLSFVSGQMTVITGIPGSGKDEFLNEITTGLAKLEEWPFAVCGFEEPPVINISKLQEKLVRKSFAFRKDPTARINRVEFEWSKEFIRQRYYFINIDSVGASVAAILSKAGELVKKYGVKGLVINPWNYLEHNIPPGQSETQ